MKPKNRFSRDSRRVIITFPNGSIYHMLANVILQKIFEREYLNKGNNFFWNTITELEEIIGNLGNTYILEEVEDWDWIDIFPHVILIRPPWDVQSEWVNADLEVL